LLFHMLFGYLLVRNLRVLVKGFSRVPDAASKRFAAILNAGTRPFHVLNYVGSLFSVRAFWDMPAWNGSWTAFSAACSRPCEASPKLR
jgi:hypothetical protein